MNGFWISQGLREFWDKATVLKLAAWAYSKQYCLSDPAQRDRELYCMSKLKNRRPKIICSLSASRRIWLLSLFQDKESNIHNLYFQKSFLPLTPQIRYSFL
jgi:hypothetical protein